MKKKNALMTGKYYGLVVTLLCVIALGCSDYDEDLVPEIRSIQTDAPRWSSILEDGINDLIIVQADHSIQDAINAAHPGDAIFIEPGTYTDQLTLDKQDLLLIGLSGPKEERVELTESIAGNVNQNQVINIYPSRRDDYTFQPMNSSDATTTLAESLRQSKKKLANDIVHYIFNVRVGGHASEVVRLHRVVKEKRSGQINPTLGAVFMIHGSSQDFDDIFFYAGAPEATTNSSCPVFLADQDLDVWGIDLGWTKVSLATQDFSFMQHWGVERDVKHVLRAMGVARLIRGMTGQGFGKINLLGFSYGATVAYAAAGLETQQHPVQRHVNGIIPVDQAFKFAPEDEPSRTAACRDAASRQQLLSSGTYQDPGGQGAAGIGHLAINDPDGASPVVANLTNYQAGLFIGTNTYLQRNIPGDFWHFVAGDMSQPTDLPTQLLYTDPQRWFGLLAGLPPYQPVRIGYDVTSCLCNEDDVSFDDFTDQINIPILYIGAAGATGYAGEYSLGLTASDDVSSHVVTLQSNDQSYVDFGHGDLFLAEDAGTLVWGVLNQWLAEH